MDPKTQKALTDYAVASWDFPASAAEELKRVIDEKADEDTFCFNCGGGGVVSVPSMLGYGTEEYPCNVCNLLSEEEKEQVRADTAAKILHDIR